MSHQSGARRDGELTQYNWRTRSLPPLRVRSRPALPPGRPHFCGAELRAGQCELKYGAPGLVGTYPQLAPVAVDVDRQIDNPIPTPLAFVV